MVDILIILWVVCGVLSAVLAKAKGRSIVGWLALGFLLGVLGPIIVALLPPKLEGEVVRAEELSLKAGEQSPEERDRQSLNEFALCVVVGLLSLGVIYLLVMAR